MSDVSAGRGLELAVEPHNDQYRASDDRWRDQVATLFEELHAQVDVIARDRPVAGAKGSLDQLVIALGSAGAFGAAVDCFRAWLARDKDRRIDVRWDEGGVEHHVTLTGEGMDAESAREIARAAAERVGGQVWAAGTEQS
jgi:Effector Associated Constant Component 1